MSNTTIFNIISCTIVGLSTIFTVVFGMQEIKKNIKELEDMKKKQDAGPSHYKPRQ